MSGHLLVVDWDYFFPNPFDGGDHDAVADSHLYDWAHAETLFHINRVWQTRASSFLYNGSSLPMCSGWETFWDRFTVAEDAPLFMAESNLYAATIPAGLGYSGSVTDVADWPWDSVWLYDAHHDCGYNTTLEAWRERGTITCEDWMLVHHEAGSKLHMRYPAWKTRAFEVEKRTRVPVDRRFDDGAAPPVVFDAVFLCRSGAWVPPWCDHQFEDFASRYPGGDVELAGPLPRRALDRDAVNHEVEMMRKLTAMMPMLREKGQA